MKVLIVGNYKGNTGSISGQIDLLLSELPKENIFAEFHNTHGSYFHKFISFPLLLIRSRRFDVIHAHGCSYLGFYPIAISIISAWLWGKKSIATYHGGGAEQFLQSWNWMLKYFFQYLSVLITLSPFLHDTFYKFGYKSVIVPNIINDNINVFKIRKNFNPKFITIRSLEEIYNIRLAIDAFQVIQSKYNNATLTIIGDGGEKLNLENYVSKLDIHDVVFKGKIDNKSIYTELNKADIMINPSTIDNYPLSIIEGYLNGILVISSDVGGIKYIVKDGETGYLFQSNNLDKLQDKILKALADQNKNILLVNNGLMFSNSLKWSNQKNKLISIYNN